MQQAFSSTTEGGKGEFVQVYEKGFDKGRYLRKLKN